MRRPNGISVREVILLAIGASATKSVVLSARSARSSGLSALFSPIICEIVECVIVPLPSKIVKEPTPRRDCKDCCKRTVSVGELFSGFKSAAKRLMRRSSRSMDSTVRLNISRTSMARLLEC